MATLQEQFDDAMFEFSQGGYDGAIARLKAILAQAPDDFDAQLALGMAYCRKGDFQAAIVEGHKAEKLRPQEQLVHTNLSLFYLKAGDKAAAEQHGLQARIASWRGNMVPPASQPAGEPALQVSKPPPPKPAPKLPAMPWKKKTNPGDAAEKGPQEAAGGDPGAPAAQP